MPLPGGLGHIDNQAPEHLLANSQPPAFAGGAPHADTQAYSAPLYPQPPSSDPLYNDWAFIRTIDVQTLADSPIRLMSSIDTDTARRWARMQTNIVDFYTQATSQLLRDTALLWWAFAHSIMLRERGQGRNDTASHLSLIHISEPTRPY